MDKTQAADRQEDSVFITTEQQRGLNRRSGTPKINTTELMRQGTRGGRDVIGWKDGTKTDQALNITCAI